jgi:hypothetical protein
MAESKILNLLICFAEGEIDLAAEDGNKHVAGGGYENLEMRESAT